MFPLHPPPLERFDSKTVQSHGRIQGGPERTSVVAQVLFGLLDASENLLEENFVLGLLDVLQNRQSSRAGPAAGVGAAARMRTAGRLDGFVGEAVCGLLAPLQELIVFHLDRIHSFVGRGTCDERVMNRCALAQKKHRLQHPRCTIVTMHTMNAPPEVHCTARPPR